jgi:hypothetical protein
LGSQVSGVVETKVWTADKQPRWCFSRKNDWVVQVIPQHAIKAIRVISTRKNGDRAAGVGVVLFTTALGLYGGVLWSGERQGFVIHEAVPADGRPMADGRWAACGIRHAAWVWVA